MERVYTIVIQREGEFCTRILKENEKVIYSDTMSVDAYGEILRQNIDAIAIIENFNFRHSSAKTKTLTPMSKIVFSLGYVKIRVWQWRLKSLFGFKATRYINLTHWG